MGITGIRIRGKGSTPSL
ncbi:hypothetical protein Gotur_013365 [Gossypium turneri]